MSTNKTSVARRNFLKQASFVSVGFMGFQSYSFADQDSALSPSMMRADGYGELQTDPYGVIDLPEGFSYKLISKRSLRMSDGLFVPGNPDGMAAFPRNDGKVTLIRNHELGPQPTGRGPYGWDNQLLPLVDKDKVYDYGHGKYPGIGGTTTLVYDPKTERVVFEYLSLAGTVRNCAGGVTPWGSWISCEETMMGLGDPEREKNHGYNFEVPSDSLGLCDPIPLKDMGRFNHESVCVDPKTGIVYETEDRGDGLLYRFLPNVPGKLHKGGKLQALALVDNKYIDVRNWKQFGKPHVMPGDKLLARWIDLDGIDSKNDDLRLRGYQKGALRFARGEGMWFGENEFYFACTNGGRNEKGQIFRYRPSPHEGSKQEADAPAVLELFAEPNNKDALSYCDNITIAPWGDLIACEDQPYPRLVGITPEGRTYHLAHNVGYGSEFTGACFSPDGSTLFVNIQGPGLTYAIKGPWKNRRG